MEMTINEPASLEGVLASAPTELLFIETNLVHLKDQARIIGPMTREELNQKRDTYEALLKEVSRSKTRSYYFSVYRYSSLQGLQRVE